jgi:tripeptidyl-peptidase I
MLTSVLFISRDLLNAQNFLSDLRPDIPSDTTFQVQEIDDGQNTQDPNDAGIEANLDIQYTVGVATGVPVVFISVGDDNQDGNLGGFLDIINFVSEEDNRPQVLTTSYGQNENTISRSLAVYIVPTILTLSCILTVGVV